jgi:hypothetical protein
VVLLLPAAGARGAGRPAEPDHAVRVLEGGRHPGVGLCGRRPAHRVQEDHGVLSRPCARRDQDQVEDERVQGSRGRGRRRRRCPTTEPYSPGNDSMPTGRKSPLITSQSVDARAVRKAATCCDVKRALIIAYMFVSAGSERVQPMPPVHQVRVRAAVRPPAERSSRGQRWQREPGGVVLRCCVVG